MLKSCIIVISGKCTTTQSDLCALLRLVELLVHYMKWRFYCTTAQCTLLCIVELLVHYYYELVELVVHYYYDLWN